MPHAILYKLQLRKIQVFEMRKLVLIVLTVLLVGIVGGAVVLANWTIPAPTGKIEQTVPDEKLAK